SLPTSTLTTYARASLGADSQIADGQNPSQIAALTDAAQFAQAVEALATTQAGHSVPIYVTGHSLGGIEAQAEAKALITSNGFGLADFGGGATFGATGLPGQNTPGGPSTGPTALTNYVDYGDPVGNNAEDTDTENPLAPEPAIYHYGKVV